MQSSSYIDGVEQSRSSEFDTAAVASSRVPRVSVDVVWTDPYIDSSIVVSVNTENRASVNDHAADLVSKTPLKYALLDGTFTLDGSCHPFPGTVAEKAQYQVGWYGNTESGAGGSFAAPYPTLEVTFDARPVFGVYVVGEPTLGQYPVDFNIQIFNGTSLLQSIIVTDNDAVEFQQSVQITAATKIVLIITKWSDVGTCCKIVEFYTSIVKTYDGTDILSMNILEEREIRDGSLPIGNISSNELDIEFQNVKLNNSGTEIIDPFFPGNDDSFLSNLVRPNRKITPYLGFRLPNGDEELIKLGTFWSGDWNIDSNSVGASTSCRDRLDLLSRAKFVNCPLFEDYTFTEILEYILTDAQINIPMSDLSWDIDSELDGYSVPFAWFEGKNYAEAIREVVEACCGLAYMSKDDVLVIEGPSQNIPDISATPDLTVTKDHYFGSKQPSKIDELINVVFVETQPVAEPASSEVVYTSEETYSIGPVETLDDVTIKYTDVPIKDAAATAIEETGSVSIDFPTADYYAGSAVLAPRNITGNSGTFKIQVSGKKLEIDGAELITDQDDDSIMSNGRLEYTFPKNILIQTRSVAETIAAVLLQSYSIERKDIELDWMGNPAVELGDMFEAPEYQRGSIDNRENFLVFKNKLDFDGTLRGTLSGRRVTRTDPETLVVQDSDGATTEYQDGDGVTTEHQDGDL